MPPKEGAPTSANGHVVGGLRHPRIVTHVNQPLAGVWAQRKGFDMGHIGQPLLVKARCVAATAQHIDTDIRRQTLRRDDHAVFGGDRHNQRRVRRHRAQRRRRGARNNDGAKAVA